MRLLFLCFFLVRARPSGRGGPLAATLAAAAPRARAPDGRRAEAAAAAALAAAAAAHAASPLAAPLPPPPPPPSAPAAPPPPRAAARACRRAPGRARCSTGRDAAALRRQARRASSPRATARDALAVAKLVASALLEKGARPPRADADGAGEPFAWVVPSSWRFLHGMPARHAHHASLYT